MQVSPYCVSCKEIGDLYFQTPRYTGFHPDVEQISERSPQAGLNPALATRPCVGKLVCRGSDGKYFKALWAILCLLPQLK